MRDELLDRHPWALLSRARRVGRITGTPTFEESRLITLREEPLKCHERDDRVSLTGDEVVPCLTGGVGVGRVKLREHVFHVRGVGHDSVLLTWARS